MVHSQRDALAAISGARRRGVVDSFRDSPNFAWSRLRACPKLGCKAILRATSTRDGLSNLFPSTISHPKIILPETRRRGDGSQNSAVSDLGFLLRFGSRILRVFVAKKPDVVGLFGCCI